MFLNRERPETDDFAIKKYLVVKEKYLVEISIFLKMSLIILAFQNISGILFFPCKNLHFRSGQGFCPHPPQRM